MLYMVPYLATKGGSKMSFVVLTDADSASEAKSLAGAIVKLHGKARPEFNLEGMFKPFTVVAPEVDDLPEEDTVDFGWLERYEVADDKKSFIPLHQQDHEDNAGADETGRSTENQQDPQSANDGDLPSHGQEPRAYFSKMSHGTKVVAIAKYGFQVIDTVLTKAQMKDVVDTTLSNEDPYYADLIKATQISAIMAMEMERYASFIAGIVRRYERSDSESGFVNMRKYAEYLLTEPCSAVTSSEPDLPTATVIPSIGEHNLEMHTALSITGIHPSKAEARHVKNARVIKEARDPAWRAWYNTYRVIPGIQEVDTDTRHAIVSEGLKNLKLITDNEGRLHFVKSRLAGHPACPELADYTQPDPALTTEQNEKKQHDEAEPLPPGATDVLADDQPTNETVADSADNAGDTAPTAQGELAAGAENIASNDGEKQEVPTEQECDPPRRIKIRDAILSALSGETCVMSPDEMAELLTYVGEGISHSYLARLLAKEIEPCDPFQQLTGDQIHHLTFDVLGQWMNDKEARCQLINERVELYLSENTSNEGEKPEVGQQQEGEFHSIGGGKFEFDAAALFASSPLATNNTASDFRENEDLTTADVREFLETSTNPADLSGDSVMPTDEHPTEKPVISAPPYFEPGRYQDIPNEVYHSANGISSTMAKDARISLMYYHGRHVIKSIQRERTDALTFGSLVHTLALEPEKLDAEFSVEPLIPEGAFTDTASMRAFIDKHNAALPKQADADTLRAVIEKHNATLPVPYALGGNADEIGQFYCLLPVEFQRIGEDQKLTATAMKARIKEFNATLPVPLKTSGSRDALLEQLEAIDSAFVELERAIPAPLPVSGSKEEMAARIKTILPTAVFADELISAWKNNNDQRQTITQAQMKHAKAIQYALLSHPLAGQWLQHPQRATEVSYFGIEDETGLDVRVRPDLEVDTGARRIAIDLKTVSLPYVKQDNLRHRLHREIIERDYHMSAGMYCDVGMFDQFFWIFVNKEPGYHWVAVVEASADELALGRAIYKQQLAAIRNAMDTGVWPGPITEAFTDTLTEYELSRLKELSGEPS